MTFPYAPARGRAAECKPSPRKGAAALPAELPAQPPQPPKYRQFFKLVICLKAQVCKRRKTATNRRPKSPPLNLTTAPSGSSDRRGDHRNGSRSSGGTIGNRADRVSEERATGCNICQEAKPAPYNSTAGEDTSTHGSGGNISQRQRPRQHLPRTPPAEHRSAGSGTPPAKRRKLDSGSAAPATRSARRASRATHQAESTEAADLPSSRHNARRAARGRRAR